MFRLIKYSSNAYSCYKNLPIVLVVATKSFAASFKGKFITSPSGFLLKASIVFWTKQLVLLSAKTISEHFNEATINSMAALGFFLMQYLLCQVPERRRPNKTLLMLPSIVKEILSQNDQEKSRKQTLYKLNQAKRLLDEILEEAESQVEISSKKTKKYAQEGILSLSK